MRPSRKEASRHELSHPTDTDLCRPAHDRGARRRVCRAQRHHQPRTRGHHDLRRVHWRALRAPDAGRGHLHRCQSRRRLGHAAGPRAAGHAHVGGHGRAVFAAAVVRVDQPARRSDHRRHGAQPAGACAGAVLHPHHRQPEHPQHGQRRLGQLVHDQKEHARHRQVRQPRLLRGDLCQ